MTEPKPAMPFGWDLPEAYSMRARIAELERRLAEYEKDAASPWREVVWSSPSVQGTHSVRYNVNTDDGARRLFGEGVCWGAFPDDAMIVEIRANTDAAIDRAMEGEDG